MAVETQGMSAVRIATVGSMVGDLARLDVSGLAQDDFLAANDAAARLGRLADTLRARFAGETARRSAPDLPGGGLARQQGFGTAAAMVARVTGGTAAGAMRAIETGRALASDVPQTAAQPDASAQRSPRHPFVADAVLAGDLSVDAAGLIASGLETIAQRVPSEGLSSLEKHLVHRALRLAVHEVRSLVSSAVARADVPGLEERERRQYAERFVAWKEDHHGVVTFTGRLDAVTAAPIRSVIEQVVTHDFRARRDQDPESLDQRTVGQMRADALALVCRHALGCKDTDTSGIRTSIVVR
ncbi:MAG: DUF222 domain-containing protein, partial [Demequinaceae bacterium]|nr:DUF222 domain-containing protein [Demequinaceae bacterium]